MYLYFDNNNEYILSDGSLSPKPLGTAFIDLLTINLFSKNSILDIPDDNAFKNLITYNGCLTAEERITFFEYYAATDYVLNMDTKYFKNMDILTRYFLYQSHAKDFSRAISVNMQYVAVPIKGTLKSINNENNNGHNTLNAIETISEDFEANLIELYTINNIEEAFYISFLKMVYNKILVKKCACCSKFFIPTGRKDTEYCNRIAPNSTKTCSEIGAIKKYHKKANKDPLQREYQKIYKRVHSCIKSKKITQNQFLIWSDKCRKIRDIAQKENWDLEKFIDEINNLEV